MSSNSITRGLVSAKYALALTAKPSLADFAWFFGELLISLKSKRIALPPIPATSRAAIRIEAYPQRPNSQAHPLVKKPKLISNPY